MKIFYIGSSHISEVRRAQSTQHITITLYYILKIREGLVARGICICLFFPSLTKY